MNSNEIIILDFMLALLVRGITKCKGKSSDILNIFLFLSVILFKILP